MKRLFLFLMLILIIFSCEPVKIKMNRQEENNSFLAREIQLTDDNNSKIIFNKSVSDIPAGVSIFAIKDDGGMLSAEKIYLIVSRSFKGELEIWAIR